MSEYLIAALYQFVSLSDYSSMQKPLLAECKRHGVTGTLLLAPEGINGTIAGPEGGVHAVLAYLRSDPRMANLEHKESWASHKPFYRMKVKLKREIVTMGVNTIDPATMAGEYVAPEQWNDLIADPDVVLVDVRNDYEVDIGTFETAINPNTAAFSDFPAWVEQQSEPGGVLDGKRKVAMFCTGGIRCEKSTAYLKSQGFDDVYHLQGGILKYLESIPAEKSRWQGDCFVFDERVSVKHGLQPGEYELCRGCRKPIDGRDKASDLFELGVSCPHCHDSLTDDKRARLRERQHQIDLAQQRNEQHIGVCVEIKKQQAREQAEQRRLRAEQAALKRASEKASSMSSI